MNLVVLVFLLLSQSKPLIQENKVNSAKEYLHSLSESFEGSAVPQWFGINKDGTADSDRVHVIPLSNAHDGTHVTRFGSYSTYDASEWLITPPLRVTDSSDSFMFWFKGFHDGAKEVFRIQITDSMPTGPSTDTTLFTILHNPDTVTDTLWHSYWMTLKNYVNKNIRITIHYTSNYQWYLYVDDFHGPLVDTIAPYIKLVYPHSHFREAGRTRDTVKFLITDTSGVRKAYIYDWEYKKRHDDQWTDKGFSDLVRYGDTFYKVIDIQDSTLYYFYVYAEDSAGNYRYAALNYNILPTMDWLIIYYYQSDAQRVASYLALRDTIIYPDSISVDRYLNLDSKAIDSLYQGIIWTTYKLTYSYDTSLITFLRKGDQHNRKHLIIFGDDIGYYENYYHRDTIFLEKYLKTRFIQDDWSYYTDTDTLSWLTEDHDTFIINSVWPDLLFKFSMDSFYDSSRDNPTWVYINPAKYILSVENGDSAFTPGGFYVSDLYYLSHFFPFRPYNMTQVDFDTLMDRVIYNSDLTGPPSTIDSGNIVRPDSTVAPADSLTDYIIGAAFTSYTCDNQTNNRLCGERIIAQVGWGPDNSYPWEGGWHWFNADTVAHHIDTVNYTYYVADTFAGRMIAPSHPGHYDYAYRYAIMHPLGQTDPWVYADLDGVHPNDNSKLMAYDYDTEEAGDLKVLYSFDVAALRIDTIIGKHWVGDTDTVFVVFKNDGYYTAKYDAFLQLNGLIQDSSINHALSPNTDETIKLRFVHSSENSDTLRIYSKWPDDQDNSNDSIISLEKAKPYGLYLVENFDTWMPSGWSIDHDVSYGWEHGTDSIYGDPSKMDGPFARFDSWYTPSDDYEYLVSPIIEVWNVGNMRMRFYYINKDGTDSLIAMHRIDNGAWQRDVVLRTASSWTQQQIIYRDLSARKGTVDTLQIRFYALSDYGYTNIGLDSVMIFDATQLGKYEEKKKPLTLKLYKIYPQPAVNELTIKFDLPDNEKVSLNLYDIQGRLIKTLASDVLKQGTHVLHWNGNDNRGRHVSSGIYFIKLKTSKKVLTDRLIYIRR